jgi:formylglycine-generating enzyme
MKLNRKIIRLTIAAICVSTVAAFCSKRTLAQESSSTPRHASQEHEPANQPENMVWIPSGEFAMGTDDVRSFPNERPAHRVHVEGFWIDEHDVTNAEFAKFVEATGYVTTAERKPDWEELKKQLPPGTPKPDDSVLVAGSLVFTPTSRAMPPRFIGRLASRTRWIS